MKANLKRIVIAVIMAALIGGYYYYLTSRDTRTAEDDVEVTQLQKVLSKQLDVAYPPTPREVVKFYNRIIECAYGSEYNQDQFGQLMAQARMLMDEELLQNNPQEDYKNRFQEEVALYKEHKRTILNTTICDSDEVTFDEIKGRKCAFVLATYFMKDGSDDFLRTYQKYLLRQDDSGNWKILAYHTTDVEEG